MLETGMIEKSSINQFLKDHMPSYIDELMQDNNSEEFYRYLSFLSNITKNLNEDRIKVRLSDINVNAALNEFDLPNGQLNNIIESTMDLLVSIEILKIQPFLFKDCTYDIFLSHCSWDAREVFGIKLFLKYEYGLSAYVDWIDDKETNFPRAVNKILSVVKEEVESELYNKLNEYYIKLLKSKYENLIASEQNISDLIIEKLQKSNSVFCVQSRHYDHSRWVPYELGLGEASEKSVYRFPIKYRKLRKKYGKKSGFLVRYDSIIDSDGSFKENKFKSELDIRNLQAIFN